MVALYFCVFCIVLFIICYCYCYDAACVERRERLFCVDLLVEFETRGRCVVFGCEALNRIAERGGRWLG